MNWCPRPAPWELTRTHRSQTPTHHDRHRTSSEPSEEDPKSAQPNAPGPRQNSRDDLLNLIQPADPAPRPSPGDDMLTLKEACRFLRVPEGTLRYWRHLGCGPRSFKVGRHVRYWRADLVLWLTEQTNRPKDRR